jgi:hypothetical protein
VASGSSALGPDLRRHVLKSAAVLVITGFLGWAITLILPLSGDLKTACVGLAVLTAFVAYALVRGAYLYFTRDIGAKYMSDETGIVQVFPNLEACKLDMQQDFRKASQIRMLLQIGRKEFGDSGASYFADDAKLKVEPGCDIRVLRASKASPFLSAARAAARHTDIRRWQEDMRRLEAELDLLRQSHGVTVDSREHSEPFLWRMFLFDDVAYVSGYLHQRDNDRKADVYKLQKGEKSLYAIFDRYFEYLWAATDPDDPVTAVAAWALAN